MIILQFILFLFFPAGWGFLTGFVITWSQDKNEYPFYINPFFVLWILQAVVWVFLVTYVI